MQALIWNSFADEISRWHARVAFMFYLDFFFHSSLLINFSSFVWNYFHCPSASCCFFIKSKLKWSNKQSKKHTEQTGQSVAWICSVHITICRLLKFLILHHFVFETNKDFLHGVGWVPIFKHVEFVGFNRSIILVNTWDVDFRIELDGGWSGWIVIVTFDAHHIDPVIKVGVRWPNDGSIPVSERFIVSLVEPVRHRLIC